MFNYLSCVIGIDDELQGFLNHYGEQGWRLHTCEPIRAGFVLVVMDRLVDTAEREHNTGEPEAIKVG